MSSDSMSLPSNRFIADEKYNQNVNANQLNKIDINISSNVLSVNHLTNPNNTELTVINDISSIKPQERSLGFTKNIQDMIDTNYNNGKKENRNRLLDLNQINNANTHSRKSDHDNTYPTILNSPKLRQNSVNDTT